MQAGDFDAAGTVEGGDLDQNRVAAEFAVAFGEHGQARHRADNRFGVQPIRDRRDRLRLQIDGGVMRHRRGGDQPRFEFPRREHAQLLVDALAEFAGERHDGQQFRLGPFPVGMQDLQQSGTQSLHGGLIAAGQARVHRHGAHGVDEGIVAQLHQHFAEIVDDEADARGDRRRGDLGHLPTGDVAVHAVVEGAVDQRARQRFEQVVVLRVRLRPLDIDIPREDEARVRREADRPAAELAALHVVFQRGDRLVAVAEGGVGDLVEDDDFARAEDADLLRGEVHEQVRRRRAAPGNGEDARRQIP